MTVLEFVLCLCGGPIIIGLLCCLTDFFRNKNGSELTESEINGGDRNGNW